MSEVHPAELQRRKGEAGKLFRELKAAEGDCKRSLQLCDQILRLLPGDGDAIAWRVQTMAKHSRFGDTAKFLEAQKQAGHKIPALHLAYAYYRLANEGGNGAIQLGKAEEALRGEADSQGRAHLLAQILYKKAQMTSDDFSASAECYAGITKQGETEEVNMDEVLCNASAAAICAGDAAAAQALLDVPARDTTQDMWYNKACFHIAREQWADARRCLDSAERTCRAGWEEEGEVDEDALMDEIAPVRVQTAYIETVDPESQASGREKASKDLVDVLRRKPSSKATVAVASNNLAAQQHDPSLFDAFKRVKMLTEAHFDSKLSKSQRAAVRFNKASLALRLGNLDGARAEAERLLKDDASVLGAVASASVLCTEKKFGRAEDLLRGVMEKVPADAPGGARLRLALAQIHLQQSNNRAAAACLSDVSTLRHRLGMVASIVAAYEAAGDIDAAVDAIDRSVAHWRERRADGDADGTRHLTALLKASAELKNRHHLWAEGAKSYRELIQLTGASTDPLARAGYVTCLARTDLSEAGSQAALLPQGDLEPAHIASAAAIELLGIKAKELSHHQSADAAQGQKRKAEEDARNAKRRKRRSRGKPEHAKGDPDPERWLKMKDRASYQALPKRHRKEAKKAKQEQRVARLRRAAHLREEDKDRRRQWVEAMREARQASS